MHYCQHHGVAWFSLWTQLFDMYKQTFTCKHYLIDDGLKNHTRSKLVQPKACRQRKQRHHVYAKRRALEFVEVVQLVRLRQSKHRDEKQQQHERGPGLHRRAERPEHNSAHREQALADGVPKFEPPSLPTKAAEQEAIDCATVLVAEGQRRYRRLRGVRACCSSEI